MRKLVLSLTLLLLLKLGGCAPADEAATNSAGPIPINALDDLCQLCWMPIADNAFACEAIQSDKVLKFDALECLVGYLHVARMSDSVEVRLYVRDVNTKRWVEATRAWYFHGDITTPMGGGLLAFSDSTDAAVLLKDFKGRIIRWQEVKQIPWADIVGRPVWKR